MVANILLILFLDNGFEAMARKNNIFLEDGKRLGVVMCDER